MGRSGVIKAKSGERTLLASVVLSSPGPIVVGIGLLLGRSSTQFADFIRRTAELAAIIVSWIIFNMTHKDGVEDTERKEKLENIANLCVGAAMSLSGMAILLIAFISYGGEKGNVIPGLVIAVLGVITNSWFWLRYHKLNSVSPNAILAVQSKLYRAKSFVDACVMIALAAIVIAPESGAVLYMDVAGSAAVSVYLLFTGFTTVFGKCNSPR